MQGYRISMVTLTKNFPFNVKSGNLFFIVILYNQWCMMISNSQFANQET